MPHAIYEDPDHIGFYKVIWVSEEDYKIILDREEDMIIEGGVTCMQQF